MYWIYLIIFILAVFSPELIYQGLFIFGGPKTPFSVRTMEELSIFILGIIGFSVYLWKEKQLKINREEKSKIQNKVARMSKALKDSYTYIGEINRKIDIMKNIALGFPEVKDAKSLKGMDIYNSLAEAIKIFCKTNNFLIRVVNARNNETELEIPNGSNMEIKIKNNSLGIMKENDFFQTDDFFIFRSSQIIDDKRSYVFVKKIRPKQIEDIDVMRTITTQILFLFILLKKLKLKY